MGISGQRPACVRDDSEQHAQYVAALVARIRPHIGPIARHPEIRPRQDDRTDGHRAAG